MIGKLDELLELHELNLNIFQHAYWNPNFIEGLFVGLKLEIFIQFEK